VIYFTGYSVPKIYRDRRCTGIQWKREFPDTDSADIRKFLTTFTDAFAFNNSSNLKFSPNDSIYEIYKAIYPKNWGVDSLELETFSLYLEERYEIDLQRIWSTDLTLGDIYNTIISYRCNDQAI